MNPNRGSLLRGCVAAEIPARWCRVWAVIGRGTASAVTSRISQVTLDVQDVSVMAEFWAAALGYTVDIGDDGCAMLNPPNGGEPTLWLQSGAAPATGKL